MNIPISLCVPHLRGEKLAFGAVGKNLPEDRSEIQGDPRDVPRRNPAAHIDSNLRDAQGAKPQGREPFHEERQDAVFQEMPASLDAAPQNEVIKSFPFDVHPPPPEEEYVNTRQTGRSENQGTRLTILCMGEGLNPRWRAFWVLCASVVFLSAAFFILFSRLLPTWIEREISEMAREKASQRGFQLSMDSVHFDWFRPLQIAGLRVQKKEASLSAARVEIYWTYWGASLLERLRRVDVWRLEIRGPQESRVEITKSQWDIHQLQAHHARLKRVGTREEIEFSSGIEPGAVELSVHSLDLGGGWLRVFIKGQEEPLSGRVSGLVRVNRKGGLVSFGVVGWAEQMRPPGSARIRGLDSPQPVDLQISAEGNVDAAGGTAILECAEMSIPGFRARISGRLHWSGKDLWIWVEFPDVTADLSRLLSVAGVTLPDGVTVPQTGLGTACLSGQIEGFLYRPSSWKVPHQLEFAPAAEAGHLADRFRGEFVQTVEWPKGKEFRFVAGPSNPNYIPFDSIPPLLVRALLIAEDANFYGHKGIDLEAIPVAFSLNLKRGGPLRGASTITQQLVKNLVLSKERTIRRKLQEVSLALLFDSTLPKRRILEIYLNVIEWGPGIYGLGAASQHYFKKTPGELTPREMAFLVTLIPGPIRYQSSLSNGFPSAGFDAMVDRLLTKLESVGALSEEEYQAALLEIFQAGPRGEPLEEQEPQEEPPSG